MYCTKCREEKEGAATYCDVCGTPLSKRCKECGAVLPAEAIFCTECGSKVEEETSCEMGAEEEQVRFCSECGHELGEETSVCSNCGWGKEEATKKESINRDEDKKIDSSKNENALDKQYHIQLSGKQLVLGVAIITLVVAAGIGLFLKKGKSGKQNTPVLPQSVEKEIDEEKKKEANNTEQQQNFDAKNVDINALGNKEITLSGTILNEEDYSYLVLNQPTSFLLSDFEDGSERYCSGIKRIKVSNEGLEEVKQPALEFMENGVYASVKGEIGVYRQEVMLYVNRVWEEERTESSYNTEQLDMLRQLLGEQAISDVERICQSMFSQVTFSDVSSMFGVNQTTLTALQDGYEQQQQEIHASNGPSNLTLMDLNAYFYRDTVRTDGTVQIILSGAWYSKEGEKYSAGERFFYMPLMYKENQNNGSWQLTTMPTLPMYYDSAALGENLNWNELVNVDFDQEISFVRTE